MLPVDNIEDLTVYQMNSLLKSYNEFNEESDPDPKKRIARERQKTADSKGMVISDPESAKDAMLQLQRQRMIPSGN